MSTFVLLRSIADSINSTASRSKVFGKAIPRNRDDEARIAAIEKELIKLGSEVIYTTHPGHPIKKTK